MGLIDDLAAKHSDDPDFARAFENSYQEGLHSSWAYILTNPGVQNAGGTDVEISPYYAASSSNLAQGLKEHLTAA